MLVVARKTTTSIAALMLLAAFGSGCGKKDHKNDDDDAGDGGGTVPGADGTGGSDDALPADEYRGVYQLSSQVETPFASCDDAKAKPVDGFDKLPGFFKLDLEYEYTEDLANPKYDLWLSGCSDQGSCQGVVTNFLFPDKTDGVWGGQTSLGISTQMFEGKCSFSYTERTATLTGKDIVIVTTDYSGDVAPIGGACSSQDGGAELQQYYETYRGKLPCSGRETIKGVKLDVAIPE
jgi:hypothetical protein